MLPVRQKLYRHYRNISSNVITTKMTKIECSKNQKFLQP